MKRIRLKNIWMKSTRMENIRIKSIRMEKSIRLKRIRMKHIWMKNSIRMIKSMRMKSIQIENSIEWKTAFKCLFNKTKWTVSNVSLGYGNFQSNCKFQSLVIEATSTFGLTWFIRNLKIIILILLANHSN